MGPISTGVLLMGDLPSGELASLASRIEDWGYDYIWLADERFFREVYSSLTLCALNTNKVRLGVCVTDPYSRHPALTTMAVATLDEISQGRAVLGIGAGVAGFEELGIDRLRPALAMREMASLVRELMSGRRVDFQGRTVSFRDGALNFTPLRADVPIYVASNSPKGLQAAGELAEGVIVSSCVREAAVDYALGMVSKGAAKVGRDPAELDLVARLNCCISADPEEARDAVRTSATRGLPGHLDFIAASGITVPQELAVSLRNMGYTHDEEKLTAMASQVPDDLIDTMALAGTVDEVAGRVLKIAGRGITHVIVRPSPSRRGGIEATLEAFATQVMPRVRQESAAGG